MSTLEIKSVEPRLPLGFSAAGVSCGIKRVAGKLDLTLVKCDHPSLGIGVYTQNQVVAAPVVLDRQRTPSDGISAVVINSGNANACTGPRGMQDASTMVRLTADACGCDESSVLVMSTGIIGEFLPMPKIAEGIHRAASSLSRDREALQRAAEGILTTDNGAKVGCRELRRGDKSGLVTGIAKGAGMIAPNMATMLALIMTDIAIPMASLEPVFRQVVDETFNAMVVDGHTSTNDTAILLSTGAADWKLDQLQDFRKALHEVCTELAQSIANDGEGATHVMEICVRGCASDDDAKRIARTIGCSPLVKTAVAGNDPNWGRIVSAAGYAGVRFDAQRLSLSLNGTLLFQNGQPHVFDAAAVSQSMQRDRIVRFDLALAEGDGEARFWASDLTAEYVRINADYHT